MFNLFNKAPKSAQELGYYDQAIDDQVCEAMAIFCEFDGKHRKLLNDLLKNLQGFINDTNATDQVVIGDWLLIKNGASVTLHALTNYS